MGLNLTRLASIKAAVEKTPAVSAIPAPVSASLTPSNSSKDTVLVGLANLKSLQATIPAPQSSKPVESAGTISYQEVSDKIRDLDASIKATHPTMPKLLHDIWGTLQTYPECVTLLEESQIEIVISGLEKLVDTDLAAITLKSAVKGTKSKTPVSNAQLGF